MSVLAEKFIILIIFHLSLRYFHSHTMEETVCNDDGEVAVDECVRGGVTCVRCGMNVCTDIAICIPVE